MISRIVKMTFHEVHISSFIKLFENNKEKIASSNGCASVLLLNDVSNPCIFFTYSVWQSTEHLELYRNSELFKTVWSQTKVLFSNKPEAWSCTIK